MGEPFKELKVWRLARRLVLEVYRVTREFPSEERYCLVQQMRRAAIAVAANIAEGNSRRYRREYLQFCHVARGSLSELKCYLDLCGDLEYLNQAKREALYAVTDELGRMLQGLITHLTSAT